MATSGLVFAIHSLDFSKPEKTRFQYGSSVCLLSIAAPIAGTCEDATPAKILATSGPRFRAGFRFGGRFQFGCRGLLRLRCRLRRRPLRPSLGLARRDERTGLIVPAPAAIAFDRAAALEHHLGVVLLRGAGHHRGEMAERMTVGGAEL